MILGAVLGTVFGASSLYLVLKVGLTVSASIPVAVISITFFRLLSKLGGRDATILENNIVQTAGSAGRIDRLRHRRDDAGHHDSGLRSRSHARAARRRPRRAARHPHDDSAPARADRPAARRPEVSGRHGLCGSAEGGRLRRITRCGLRLGEARAGRARRRDDERGDHLRRLRHRRPLQGAERGVQGLEGRAGERSSARRSRAARSRRRSRPSCWASATSSARGSAPSCARAACWPTSC